LTHPLTILKAAMAAITLLCAPTAIAAQQKSAAKRPNVVMIMVDDMGTGDFPMYGNPIVRMPNLTALDREGVRFSDFHVDTTCSPTRAALLTGQYSLRTGVWHTIMARHQLKGEAFTMGELFQMNGYATGIFGKWHLGDTYPLRPEDQGFDRTVMLGGGGVGQTPDAWGNTQFGGTYLVDGQPTLFAQNATDVWFDEATKFIDKETAGGKPFFAFIPTNAAHSPWRAPEQYVKPFLDMGLPTKMARYYGMVAHVDKRLGDLRAHLAKLGVERDTIILFTSDNGTSLNPKSMMEGAGDLKIADIKALHPEWKDWNYNAGLNGYKASVYEGGHRVPLFFSWPNGGLTAGREIDTLAAHFDLMPTFVDLLGLKAPKGLQFDGKSLVPVLRGQAMPERTLVVSTQRVPIANADQPAVVMTENWRYHPEEKKLFAIEQDRGQKNDVAASHQNVVKALQAAYDKWWQAMAPSVGPVVRPVIDGAQKEIRLTAHDYVLSSNSDDTAIAWLPGFGDETYGAEGASWLGKEREFAVRPLMVQAQKGGSFQVDVYYHDAPAFTAAPYRLAHLVINGQHRTARVRPGQGHARFDVAMPKGDIDLKAWFSDDPGAEATVGKAVPAFYVYLRPANGSN